MKALQFKLAPTLSRFFASRATRKFVIGPFGSGKTTAAILHLLDNACRQLPDVEGTRKTRYAIIRPTLPQLRNTVLKDVKEHFGEIADYRVSEQTIYFRFPLTDGTRVQSEWLLTPLETIEDQRKLLSLQLTGAFMNEFREIDFGLLNAIYGRCGRYPKGPPGSGWDGVCELTPTYTCLLGDTNPFSKGSEWYDNLVANKPESWEVYKQPPGGTPDGKIHPMAENAENLRAGYYEELMEGANPEWIKVHVFGEYGDDMAGQTVFRDTFNQDIHVADGPLLVQEDVTLVVGLDFGRTPCAVLGQLDAFGRYVVLDEVVSDGMGLENFLSTKLLPRLAMADMRAAGRVVVIYDPAGTQKSQVNEMSCADVVRASGLVGHSAPTNDVDARVRALQGEFMRWLRDKPGILIDPRCKLLTRALSHKYMYKKAKTGTIADKPDKTHPWSDLVDALTYMVMGIKSGVPERAVTRHEYHLQRRRGPWGALGANMAGMAARRPAPGVRGWT